MKRNESLTAIVFMFLRGLLVGLCDLVPGVSGGTILFITGVYERFINGLKDVGVFLKEFLLKLIGKNKSSFKQIFKRIDFALFLPLIIAIWGVMLIGSGIILNIMNTFPSQTYAFFVGLILASTFLMYKEIGKKNVNAILFVIIGIWVGFMVSTLKTDPSMSASYPMIVLTGAISICAMVLPGISGSYLMIVLGKYEFMLGVLNNLSEKWTYAIAFGIGGIIGLLTFSRVLSWLLKKYRSSTLSFLTGLMFGAMYGPAKLAINAAGTTDIVIYSSIFFVVGAAIVILIDRIANHKKRKQAKVDAAKMKD